jgi:hypothetical protein
MDTRSVFKWIWLHLGRLHPLGDSILWRNKVVSNNQAAFKIMILLQPTFYFDDLV